MSTTVRTIVMYGFSLPYDWHMKVPEDKYYEPDEHDMMALVDGMSGKYFIFGKVLVDNNPMHEEVEEPLILSVPNALEQGRVYTTMKSFLGKDTPELTIGDIFYIQHWS